LREGSDDGRVFCKGVLEVRGQRSEYCHSERKLIIFVREK